MTLQWRPDQLLHPSYDLEAIQVLGSHTICQAKPAALAMPAGMLSCMRMAEMLDADSRARVWLQAGGPGRAGR